MTPHSGCVAPWPLVGGAGGCLIRLGGGFWHGLRHHEGFPDVASSMGSNMRGCIVLATSSTSLRSIFSVPSAHDVRTLFAFPSCLVFSSSPFPARARPWPAMWPGRAMLVFDLVALVALLSVAGSLQRDVQIGAFTDSMTQVPQRVSAGSSVHSASSSTRDAAGSRGATPRGPQYSRLLPSAGAVPPTAGLLNLGQQ